MELVSVIIPVYNVKEHLKKCVDSVVNQTYRNIELILVDDGSTDGSGELCDRLALQDSRIKVIHKTNSGSIASRFCGLKVALGNYILFIDSDDYINRVLISDSLKKAIENNSDVVMFDAESVDENGNHIDYCYAMPEKLNLQSLNLPEILLALPSMCNKLYKKELLLNNNITISENIFIGEDLTFNAQLLSSAEKPFYYKKVLYYYVQRANTLMSGSSADKTKALRNKDLIVAHKTIKDYYCASGKYDSYRDVLNYIAIYYILTAVVRLNKTGAGKQLQSEMVDYVIKECPNFKNNKYYNLLLSKKQKTVFFLLKHKLFRTLHFVLTAKSKLTGR